MKLIKPLFLLMMIVSLVSCSSDDDNNQFLLNNANLAGTYEVTFFESTEVHTGEFDGEEIVSTTTNVGDTFEVDYRFLEDGNYLINGLYRNVTTVVVENNPPSEDAGFVVIDNEAGNYSTNSDTMRLIIDEEINEVTLFNENEIRFTFEETWIDGEDTYIYNSEIRMTRK